MQTAERLRWWALGAGIPLSVWWVLSGDLRDGMPDPSLQLTALVLLGMLTAWLMIVGLLGLGKRYLDRTSPALAYLAEGSYPVYILHQTVIVVAAFWIVGLAASEALQWLTLLVVSVAVTFALYEVVRRFAVTRFLFGMRPQRKAAVVAPEGATTPSGRASTDGAGIAPLSH
jgi:peptidoglycan/LPS O-acetylase OafA/YrhL